MINRPGITALAACCLAWCLSAAGADHKVEALAKAAPEGFSAAIASQLSDSGVKVIRGTSRTVCEIWLCKQWPLKSLKASGDVDYPFTPGQLVGVVNYPKRGSDFRDQDIDAGLYTLRYAQQPVDGAHVGTSPTRDFLLLVKAEADKSADVLDYKTLSEASIEAAQTAHPALLSLRKAAGEGKAPSIRHDEEKDWWIVRLHGKGKAGDDAAALPLDLLVVGIAEE